MYTFPWNFRTLAFVTSFLPSSRGSTNSFSIHSPVAGEDDFDGVLFNSFRDLFGEDDEAEEEDEEEDEEEEEEDEEEEDDDSSLLLLS